MTREIHYHHHYTPDTSRSTGSSSYRKDVMFSNRSGVDVMLGTSSPSGRRQYYTGGSRARGQSMPGGCYYVKNYYPEEILHSPRRATRVHSTIYNLQDTPGRSKIWTVTPQGTLKPNPYDYMNPAGKTAGHPFYGDHHNNQNYLTRDFWYKRSMERAHSYDATVRPTMYLRNLWGNMYPDPRQYMTPRTQMAQTTVLHLPANPSAKLDHFTEATLSPNRDVTTMGLRKP